MVDRHIDFRAHQVRAALDGRKTQTRRVLDVACKEPPAFVLARGIIMAMDENDRPYRWPRTHSVGDRLWLREAWKPIPDSKPGGYLVPGSRFYGREVYYRADNDCLLWAGGPWKSPSHMPRAASRLTLTVTDVRVQRLQDISEADAVAEGISPVTDRMRSQHAYGLYEVRIGEKSHFGDSAYDLYAKLWDSLHGTGAWKANPWVAAYTFTVERRNIDAVSLAAA